MTKRHLKMVVGFLLVCGLPACGGGGSNSALNSVNPLGVTAPTTQNGLVQPTSSSISASPVAAGLASGLPYGDAVAVNVGGSATGAWTADSGYSGGWVPSPVTASISTSGVIDPAPQSVYQTQRAGKSFSYAFGNLKPNAGYTLRLHMAETFWHASRARLFNVSVNGSQALTNFDIYATAGGTDVAVVKNISFNADGNGKVAVQFTATADNASIAGIEVKNGSSGPVPSPTPTASGPSPSPVPTATAVPTATPMPTATPLPAGNTISGLFVGNTPFHHKVATLENYGARVLSSQVAANYWVNGIQTTQSYEQNPVWTVTPGSPSYTFQCPIYGSSAGSSCSVFHRQIYFPAGAAPECLDDPGTCTFDYHLASVDGVYNHAEVDGWGDTYSTFSMGANGASAQDPGCDGSGTCQGGCQLKSGEAYCAWGAYFPFNSSGLATDSTQQPNPLWSKANAAGYAYGLFEVDSQDLMNAKKGIPIAHALGLATACEGSSNESSTPDVYPSNSGFGTDQPCHGNNIPNTVYGDLVHLKTSFVIPSGASVECKAVLTALQQYGAYTVDDNSYNGTAILTNQYVTNPSSWSVIQADMNAAGEGNRSGMSWSSDWCLHYIKSSSQLEVLQINQGGTAALPPTSTI